MPRKTTNLEAIEKIQNKISNKFEFLGFNTPSKEYEGKNSKIILKCLNCGKVLNDIWFSSLMSRKSIHSCTRLFNVEKAKEHAVLKIKEHLPNDFEFVEFVGDFSIADTSKFLVKCLKCGNTFTYTYHQLMYLTDNFSCKFCKNNQKNDVEKMLESINNQCITKNLTFLGFKEGFFKNNKKTHLILKCNDCGKTWDTTIVQNIFYKRLICKNCKRFWIMEKDLNLFLTENELQFEEQKTFDWLVNKNNMFLDIFIPSKNIAIECQGEEHFKPIKKFGGDNGYEQIHQRDVLKNKLCKENGIKLLYYAEKTKFNEFLGEKLIKNKEELLEIIKSYG